MVPWPVLWGEIATRRELAFAAPEFQTVATDSEAGMVRVRGGEMDLWLPDGIYFGALPHIFKEVYNPGNPHYYEFGDCRLRPGDVVVDGGACEGIFTRFALDRGAKVIVVEPWSRMADALRMTFAREIEEGRVVVERALIDSREGESTLTLNPRFPFEACEGQASSADTISEPVPVRTLDTIIQRSPWGRCDFLKMDIEGHERPALASASATLKRDRPRIAIAVYHHAQGYRDIAADLRALGLSYHVAGKGLALGDKTVWRPMLLHAWTTS